MVVLGVTGGIGSGKSTVCRTFGVLGVPVFFSDTVARDIMDSDEELKTGLRNIAGENIYRNGTLDRPKMASLIFSDRELLKKVNSLVHPAIFEVFRSWAAKKKSPYVILEAAILFESGADNLVDRVATVTAPFEERIMRVISRNNLTREQVIERMNNQYPENELIGRSDFVINNSENSMIIPQVLEVHNEMINLVNNKNN